MKQDYEMVLPDLQRAFTIAKDWTGAITIRRPSLEPSSPGGSRGAIRV
jgi:hypothetical protein